MWPVLSSSFTVEVRPPHDSPPNFKLLTSHLLSFFLLLYLHQTMPPTQNNQTLPSFRLVSSSAPFFLWLAASLVNTFFQSLTLFVPRKLRVLRWQLPPYPIYKLAVTFIRRPMLNVNPSLIPGSSYWEHMVRYPFGPRCFSRNWSIDFGGADQYLVHTVLLIGFFFSVCRTVCQLWFENSNWSRRDFLGPDRQLPLPLPAFETTASFALALPRQKKIQHCVEPCLNFFHFLVDILYSKFPIGFGWSLPPKINSWCQIVYP